MLDLFKRSTITVVERASKVGRPKTHGRSKSTTYQSWSQAKCNATLSTEFLDFNIFLRYMGERPVGYALARREISKPHSPANSFWKKRVVR